MDIPFLNNQTTQPTDGLTDAELRATPVDVALTGGGISISGLSLSIPPSGASIVFQGTAPWLTNTPGASSNVQVIGSIPVTKSGTWSVDSIQSGSWNVGQSGTWVVSGNVNLVGGSISVAPSGPVIAFQGNAPWTNTLIGTGAILSYQGGSWNTAATQFGTWTVQPGNTPNTVPWIVNSPGGSSIVVVQGTVPVTATQAATSYGFTVQGDVANLATGGGNPIFVGAQYNSAPNLRSNGSRSGLEADVSGNLKVTLNGVGTLSSVLVSGNVNVMNTVPVTLAGVTSVSGNVNISSFSAAISAVVAAPIKISDGASPNNQLSVSASGAAIVSLAAGGGDGWRPFMCSNLIGTTVIASGACKFGGYSLINLNSYPLYLQCFDVAPDTSVTLGTTVPNFLFVLPANSTYTNGVMANIELTQGISCVNGLKVAATTTALGSTAVASGAIGTLLSR